MINVSRKRKFPQSKQTRLLLCVLVLLSLAAVAHAGEEPDTGVASTEGDQQAAGTDVPEETGLVNWTTTIAQIVNFLILVALLKYFLYDRITSAIDNRAKRIASEQEEARKKQEEAEEKAKTYEKKLEESERSRQEKMQKAKEEAVQLREELTQQAREDVDKAKARWQEALQQEQEQFIQSLRSKIGTHVCLIARQAFKQLANRDLERAMVDAFLARLRDNREALDQLLEEASGHELMIRSAFEIPQDAKNDIEQAVKSNGRSLSMRFEEDENLMCGIEIRAEGNAIGWTLEKYLGEVEEEFNKTLRQSTGKE